MKSAQALIIDDNAELAENLREILENLPEYRVDCQLARSAREALEFCAGQECRGLDLVLLDIRLPDSDGLALLPTLQQRCPLAEIVIITGDTTLDSAVRAVGQGAFAYVLKPFRGEEITLTLNRALHRASLVKEGEELRRTLEESERRHRAVVEAVPAFVLALDAADRISLWNRRLEEVTGNHRAEMLGQPGRELVGAGGDRRLPLKAGGHRIARWQLTELESPAETYALGIDVTEEREVQRRVLRAERLAAVGTLAAGLAHEVRNPLNSATLQLQVLRRRMARGPTEPHEAMAIVGIVEDEIGRLDRLVKDFLAFAQPRPLDLKLCFLNELVEAVGQQIQPEAVASGVELRTTLASSVGQVEVEPERMRQVLLNLTRNALEAMRGDGVLTIRTLAADAQGNAGIAVEDTGPGFADDAPIFDAFFTTKEGGTGLGLAIVHRIVQDHGGAVSAESRPGSTRFTVLLPQRPALRPT